MVCSICGTSNDAGFKFCVKCGSSLENSTEENYAAIDKGNYHAEEEYSDPDSGFTMSEDTFVIRDTPAPVQRKKIYTSDELNDSDEEFDFSMYDDGMQSIAPPENPVIPPHPAPKQPVQQGYMQNMPNMPQQPVYPQQTGQHMNGMQTMGQPVPPMGQQMNGMPNMGQQMGGMSQMPQQPVYPQMQSQQTQQPQMQQPVMYAQPQLIGYDQNGKPIYGQPVMYQPQLMGYDQNGMPIYGQPMMYAQPQIVGYDQNGMPVYGQPAMYGQPQMMGYPNMPQQQPYPLQMGNMPQTPQPAPVQQQKKAEPAKEEEKSDNKQAFWDFFNDGKKETSPEKEEKDFFSRLKVEEVDPSDPFADIDNRRKQRLNAKNQDEPVMGNMPVVDGSKLEKNESSKINNLYMRQIKDSSSQDLTLTNGEHKQRTMAETEEVDAEMLSENLFVKSRISMAETEEVNADDIEEANTEHREAIMSQADHAVEAMPKKINPYESELDKIELPEYMQAKKTVKEENVEIPSLPDVKK